MKNEVFESWKVDGDIDAYDLSEESKRIPQLHAKYMKWLTETRYELKTVRLKDKKLRKEKYEYYTGRMSTSELAEKGWKPFPHKILKNDVDTYVEADNDIISSRLRISELEETVSFLESIVDQINKRTFVIKNMIEWNKFTNGVV